MEPDSVQGFVPLPGAEALGLENQLLALEVQVLRGRTRVLQEDLTRVQDDLSRLRSSAAPPPLPTGTIPVKETDYDDLREAKRNLRWLLRRLGSGPFGWFIRRRSGYRALADRWLDNEHQVTPSEDQTDTK